MREIKFRAWDGIRIRFGQMWLNSDNGKIECPDDVTVEQFTGIHDKNKKEIYEGDIVKFIAFDHKHDEWVTGTVVWHGTGFYVQDNDDNDLLYDLGIPNDNGLEVIGNVHENPDLISE